MKNSIKKLQAQLCASQSLCGAALEEGKIMKKIRNVLVLILILSLCGCKPAPQKNKENSSTEKFPAYSDETSNVSIASEPDNTSEIVENTKTIIPETPSHIERSATAGDITLTINADVAQFSADALYLYDFRNIGGINETLVNEIIAVMGKSDKISKINNSEYEFYLSDYPEELYSIESMAHLICLRGHTDNLCPYGSNIYTDTSAEILANYTREEAADKCLEMYGNFFDGDTAVLDIIPFGANIGSDYYKITAATLIDGLPVISERARAEFDVSDKGINSAQINNFKVERRQFIEKILPLSECVDIVAAKVDSLLLYPDPEHYDFYNYTVNEDGKLMNINVEEIRLAYIVQPNTGGIFSLCPAWVFLPGANGHADYSYAYTAFAVNAVTGEVVRL